MPSYVYICIHCTLHAHIYNNIHQGCISYATFVPYPCILSFAVTYLRENSLRLYAAEYMYYFAYVYICIYRWFTYETWNFVISVGPMRLMTNVGLYWHARIIARWLLYASGNSMTSPLLPIDPFQYVVIARFITFIINGLDDVYIFLRYNGLSVLLLH